MPPSSSPPLPGRRRRRTTIACHQCRKRKSKCGGEQPCCLVCQSADRQCTYDSQLRRRGLQSGHVRSLETVLGFVFSRYPQSDKDIRDALGNRAGRAGLLATKTAPSLHNLWRRSECAQSLERLLESSSYDEHNDNSTESPAPVGQPSEEEGPANEMDARGSRSDTHTAAALESRIAPPVVTIPVERTLLATELPREASELVNFYFSYTQCWFPVLKRSDVFKSVHTPLQNGSTAHDSGLGMRLCLWAVMAFATAHSSLKDTSLDFESLQVQITALLPGTRDNFGLDHVQTILVLVLLDIARNQIEHAWILSAQASRMILICRRRPLEDRAKFNRTVRGCVLLDSVLSEMLDHSSCWCQKDLSFLGDSFEDDSIDEWQPWSPQGFPAAEVTERQDSPSRALSSFNLMVVLVQKLLPADEARLVGDLRDWKNDLPAALKLCANTTPSPAIIHLHLTFHFVVCSCLHSLVELDEHLVNMVRDSVANIRTLVEQYSTIAGNGVSSPFLLCCLLRAVHITRHLKTNQNYDSGQAEDDRCIELLEKLKSTWKTPTVSDFPAASHVHMRSSTVDVATRHYSGLSPTWNGRSDNIFNPDSTACTNVLHSSQLGNVLPGQCTMEEGQFSRVDPADQGSANLFSDTVWPLISVQESENLSLFAQNLGFLEGSFEGDDLNTLFQSVDGL